MTVATDLNGAVDGDDGVPAGAYEQLERTWRSPPGFFGWFTQVNHRNIGRRFIATAFVFFLLGGIEALVLRTQLARPDNGLVGPDLYRQLLTMHGTTMMFFFAVPVMEGFAIYLVPLMIGTRDMAFPKLNAFGYYVYLIAGVVLYVALFLNMAPDAGWFNYVPLAGPEHSLGLRIDFWATMITFIEISALVAAVELIVTILRQRAPGMSLDRMPLFVWAILITSFMIVFAMPPVMASSILLALDRTIGTHFFNASAGGDALLWQHLFWFFGHPEVYIIFVPALGFVSSILVTFTRRPIVGYTAIVLSLVATGFIAFGLWVHHMYTTGLPQLGMNYFTAASMMIALPTGVQIFCWIATLWRSRPKLEPPMLFVLGFFAIFVLGGLTGVMVASVPFDMQAHDTFFVVAHLHYVLIGGSVFPLLGACHYWFPKITGRMLSVWSSKLSFWLSFIGFNVAFFPMHYLGLIGMPRRVYTYPAELGWGGTNLVATAGAYLLGAGVLLFVANAVVSLRRGAFAPGDPWRGDTLEWGTSSPPPSYNFLHPPVVKGRWARWDDAGDDRAAVAGLRTDRREVLVTRVVDAAPLARVVLPSPSVSPLLLAAAVAVTFVGAIFNVWAVPIGAALAFAALVGWFWPKERAQPGDAPANSGGPTEDEVKEDGRAEGIA